MTHPEPDPLDLLHSLIRVAVGEHRPSGRLAALLEQDAPAPWPEYAAALFETTIPLEEKRKLYQAWQAAVRQQVPQRPSEVRPLVPTPAAELRAATEAEFVALLKKIQLRSGLSVPKISDRAGIPRSQGYSMLKRSKLPTKPEQVHQFAIACGLPDPQVARLMELWARLREPAGSPTEDSQFAILIMRSA